MTVFRIQVNYTRGTLGKWSNVWHVNAPDLITAANAMESAGIPNLLPLLHNSAQIASFLVSSEIDDTFITRPVNAAGTSAQTDQILPLFNSVKAFLIDDSNGRPDYKYLKGYLTELLQADGLVAAGVVTAVTTNLGNMADEMNTANSPLVSADNDQYISISVAPAVQMRQMHRKRRKATP